MATQKYKTVFSSPSMFSVSFVFSFFFMVVGASTVGFVPYYIDGTEPNNRALAHSVGSIERGVHLSNLPMLGDDEGVITAAPTRIVAKSIGLDLPVVTPASVDVDVLDSALRGAVVRYPTSAMLGQKGNVLVFGHSSHLPVVHNQFYKAFNALPDLSVGDVISLDGGGLSYNYKVTSVRRADATEEYVDLSTNGGARLTLSTCDTFGKKTSRWVVDAVFVGTDSAGN